jgi:hypothetical protein
MTDVVLTGNREFRDVIEKYDAVAEKMTKKRQSERAATPTARESRLFNDRHQRMLDGYATPKEIRWLEKMAGAYGLRG